VINGRKSKAEKFDYASVNITYLCKAENLLVNQSHPDSLGRFLFQIPLVYGKPHTILQAKTLKGRKLNGEIFLDETVDPPKFAIPVIMVIISLFM
jgi:hypothetical protein